MGGKKRKKKKKNNDFPKKSISVIKNIVSGRSDCDAGQLFDLIRWINPTDRDLPPDETQYRYKLKAGLQNRLISNFAERLNFFQDSSSPGIVTIVDTMTKTDSCHALMKNLEDEVERTVQRVLDEETAEALTQHNSVEKTPGKERNIRSAREVHEDNKPENPENLEELGVDELFEKGRRLVDSYDYESGMFYWRQAVMPPRNDSAAAVALLKLMVDTLGLYAGVLELADELTGDLLRNRRIRNLLAKAAARYRQEEKARHWCDGPDSLETVEVRLFLASASLDRGDISEAMSQIDIIERVVDEEGTLPPEVAPDLEQLRSRLAIEREEARVPLERIIIEALNRGDWDVVQKWANEALSTWPESDVARRALADHERHCRIVRGDFLIRQAEEAIAAGDYPEAEMVLKEASVLVGRRDDLVTLLTLAEKKNLRKREQQQTAEVVRKLRNSIDPTSLAAYSELADHLRSKVVKELRSLKLGIKSSGTGDKAPERVKTNAAPEILEGSCAQIVEDLSIERLTRWIDELGAWDDPKEDPNTKQVALYAVFDLVRACEEISAGKVEKAENLLGAHEDLWRRCPDATVLLNLCRNKIVSLRAGRTRESLEDAEHAVQMEQIDQARKILHNLKNTDLDDGFAQKHKILLGKLEQIERKKELEALYSSRMERGDYLLARDSVDKLAALTGAAERSHWLDVSNNLEILLKQAWSIQKRSFRIDKLELGLFLTDMLFEDKLKQLTSDNEIVLACCRQKTLVLICFPLDRTEGRALIMRPAPEMGDVTSITVSGELITLVGKNGRLLTLRLDDFSVLSYNSLAIPDETIVVRGSMASGGNTLWIESENLSNQATNVFLIDPGTGKVKRTFQNVFEFFMVNSGSEPVVAITDFSSFRITNLIGKSIGIKMRIKKRLQNITVHPNGEDLCPLVVIPESFDSEDGIVRILWMSMYGDMKGFIDIEDSWSEYSVGCTTALDKSVLFVAHGYESGFFLTAYSPLQDGFRKLYTCGPFEKVFMIQDISERRTVFASISRAGTRIIPLDGETETVALHESADTSDKPPDLDYVPRFGGGIIMCCPVVSKKMDLLGNNMNIFRDIRNMDVESRQDYIVDLAKRNLHDVDMIWDLALFLNSSPDLPDAELVVRQLPEASNCSMILLWWLNDQVRKRRIEGVLETLELFEAEKLPCDYLQHFHHLKGILLARNDCMDEAEEEWRIAKVFNGQCMIDRYFDYLDAVREEPDPAGLTPEQPLVKVLVDSIRLVDFSLAVDELERALEFVNKSYVWLHREVQSFARLSFVYMELFDKKKHLRNDDNFVICMILALSKFLSDNKDAEKLFRNELYIPNHYWAPDVIDGFLIRADQMLENLPAYPQPIGLSQCPKLQ